MDDRHSDVCRVCRSEGTHDKPLFHPCICTGSIKFIHQDCLEQWLKYSKKEFCELCKHKYVFTPIYAPDMPKRLPLKDIMMGLLRSVLKAVRSWLHFTLVAMAWLGLVPLAACRMYRCLFTGTIGSLLTFPLDLLSPENLLADCLHGCFIMSCTLCAFISLIWLREQIIHGVLGMEGGEGGIEGEGGGGDGVDGEEEEEADLVVEEGNEEEGEEEDEGENEVAPAANNNQDDNNWNPIEWERAVDELTWERLLGLDGSLQFLEHVFWVVSLDALFILVFAFFPYHVGNSLFHVMNVKEAIEATQFDGVICTLLGYLVTGIFFLILNIVSNRLLLNRAKTIFALCYLGVKVFLLVSMELGVFPLACGWWLDICSLSMFDATIRDRRNSFEVNPFTSMFIHWLVGMVYIFYFASFIILLREVLRPGVLWFLRNLNDPDFNPVQEMIHLPVYRHVRRFLASLVVFGSIVIIMLKLPILFIHKTFPDFLPFHVSGSESLVNELSLELLLLHIILPGLLEQGHTRQWLKNVVRWWCVLVATILNIRSYLLGDEDADVVVVVVAEAQEDAVAEAEDVVVVEVQEVAVAEEAEDVVVAEVENKVVLDGVDGVVSSEVVGSSSSEEVGSSSSGSSNLNIEPTTSYVTKDDTERQKDLENKNSQNISQSSKLQNSSNVTSMEQQQQQNVETTSSQSPLKQQLDVPLQQQPKTEKQQSSLIPQLAPQQQQQQKPPTLDQTLSQQPPPQKQEQQHTSEQKSSPEQPLPQQPEQQQNPPLQPEQQQQPPPQPEQQQQPPPQPELHQPQPEQQPPPQLQQPEPQPDQPPPQRLLLGELHQAMMNGAGNPPFKPYTRPQHFAFKIFILLLLACVSLFITSLVSFLLPVQIGRSMMSYLSDSTVNTGVVVIGDNIHFNGDNNNITSLNNIPNNNFLNNNTNNTFLNNNTNNTFLNNKTNNNFFNKTLLNKTINYNKTFFNNISETLYVTSNTTVSKETGLFNISKNDVIDKDPVGNNNIQQHTNIKNKNTAGWRNFTHTNTSKSHNLNNNYSISSSINNKTTNNTTTSNTNNNTTNTTNNNTKKHANRVHELYTAASGLYICWLCMRLAILLVTWLPRGINAIASKCYEWIVLIFKSLLIACLMGGLIPLLMGVLFELFVLMPLRVPLHQTPVFFPWQDWMLGLLLVKIMTAFTLMGPNWRLKQLMEQAYNQGIRRMDIRMVVMELCLPVAVVLGLFISVPYAFIHSIIPLSSLSAESQHQISRRVYPHILIHILVFIFLIFQIRQFKRLYEHIKNDKYLIGLKLVNYERE